MIIILSGTGRCPEGLGGISFPLKFLETAQCHSYLIKSGQGHCLGISNGSSVGLPGPLDGRAPPQDPCPWRIRCSRRERGQGREEASRHRRAPGFPLRSESESTFLALRLSYLDPSLFLVPGTVNLAILCRDGPFQGGPHLTSNKPAVRAASSKEKTPWEGEDLPTSLVFPCFQVFSICLWVCPVGGPRTHCVLDSEAGGGPRSQGGSGFRATQRVFIELLSQTPCTRPVRNVEIRLISAFKGLK